ncbi:MAG: DNA polymerase I [Planctomycetota bacterium]
MPTLYLIDGYAQFFRAYHAIRTPMTSPVTKEPTNLTFGFVGMLLRLLRAEDELLRGDGAPTHLAVALDVSGDRGTFRSRLYPEYKATRDAPPDDLPPQVRRCIELLDAIGVPTIGSEGFEADDVIATIASRYSEEHPDVRVRIVSKDKDLKQLLGAGAPPTEMYDIHTGGLITEQTLRDEAGITPAQVIDTLALMGDTSDNVPGVPGIGEKTALKLIAELGGLDQVIAEVTADKPKKDWIIKGKRRENILASLETLALSKELVTLRRDAPAQLDLDAARTDTLDLARLLPLLKELGFGRYQDDVKALLGLPKAGDEASATTPPARTRNTGDEAGAFGGLFDQREDGDDTSPADGDYAVVRTREQLDQMLTEIRNAELLAIDTETTALRPMLAQLAGICLSDRPGRGWYVPVRAPAGEQHLDERSVLDALRPALEDASIAKLGHNIKYDMLVLRRAGVRLAGHLPGQLPEGDAQALAGDTMVASYLIDASRSSHSLDALSLGLLGRENVSITSLIGTGKKQKRFDEVPLDKAGPYAAEDADVTLRLAQRLAPPLQEMDLLGLYRDLEMPLVEVLAELEYNGILVDPGELDRQRERLEGEIERLKARIDDELYGAIGRTIDHDSPKQLSGALFAKPDAAEPGLGITPIKRTKTGYSTDAEVLTKLADDASVESPVPALVLEYRQLAKLVGTYLGSLKDEINPATGRIHASFNQTVAATGRLSSSDPNLQNIPIRTEVGREIRKAFIAPPGRVLVSADYSQIELRLLAHLSRDPALIEAFRAGEDIHSAVAAQIRGIPLSDVTKEQRSGAKMVNFGIVYGITAFGLARRLGVSNSEADEIITGYKKRFSGITTFLEECVAHAREHGYVETMCKRRRPIPDIESNQPNRRALAERTAINSVVQGSAADLIKIAMVDLHRRLATARDDAYDPLGGVLMLLQIHDELVFEAPQTGAEKARDVIVERMEAAMDLDVPLVADSSISRDWFGGK